MISLFLKIIFFCLIEVFLCVCELRVMKQSDNIGTLILLRNVSTFVISLFISKKWQIQSLKTFSIAFGFAVAQLASFICVKHLNAIMYSICNQSRIISVYILSNIFVKEEYNIYQISSIILIVISNILPTFESERDKNFSLKFFILLLLGNFFNSCSQTMFSVIKDKINDHTSYIFTVSFYQLLFAVPFFIYTYKTVKITAFQVIFTFCLAINTLVFTKIGFSISSTQRVLIRIAISLSTTLIFMMIYEDRQNTFEIVCYILSFFGIFLYHVPEIFF